MDDFKNRVEEEIYKTAKKRLKIKRGFKIHRGIYVVTVVLLTLMMTAIGIFDGGLIDSILASLVVASGWGMAVGIHFVVAMSRLKALDGNELEREIAYLKGRTGYNSLEEEKSNDVFNMNMNKIKNQKSIEKHERH
ncbi:2TM domain-containing protein [Oceanirhabdus sp. W0125-5]|uniref:2TM domain-containing protein n=1 Tax=Oceanirhabdus sp. W0125-5 TaxID=2999116 RepID=UPI0022F2A54D|nr:2TM domain-containing protein [Oceanirhabdus sp. W0125-5]WBW99100.1 2TM domain-containing protein [Oceanirhabdus sp. W0125-5]